jgi:hypothetical protein
MLISVLACLIAAQDVADAPVPTIPSFGLGRSAGVNTADDGRPVASGPDWRATFDDRGATFEPALGNAAAPLALGIAAVDLRRGDARIALVRDEPSHDGRVVAFDRARGVVERFEATDAGVEHSLVIDGPLGSDGDLVVRFELVGSAAGLGARRADGVHTFGGITYGRLFGIDANGARTDGDVRLVDGGLEWIVADAWLDGAAWPITLDPLVGSEHALTSNDYFEHDRGPDGAFDNTEQLSLVVFEHTDEEVGTTQIHARRVDNDGIVIGTPIVVSSWNASRGAVVANVAKVDRFAVVWVEDYTSGLSSVRARWIEAETGALSAVLTVATLDTVDLVGVDVAGESSNDSAVPARAFVTWCDRSVGVRFARVDLSGASSPTLVGTTTVFADPGALYSYSDVRISRCTSADGRLGMAWKRNGPVSGQSALFVSVVDRNATALHGAAAVPASGDEIGQFDIDGGGAAPTRYVVAVLEAVTAAPSRLAGIALASSGSTLTIGAKVPLVSSIGLIGPDPSVGWRPGQAFIAYESSGVNIFGVDANTAQLCAPLEVVAPYTSSSFMGFSSVASPKDICVTMRTSGGNTSTSRALLFWSEFTSFSALSQSEIESHPFDAFSPLATAVSLGGGCGSVGTIAAPQPPAIGNGTFALQLQFPGSGVLGILNIAAPQATLSCGACQFVPFATTFYVPLNPFGVEQKLPVPANATLAGAKAWAQWIVYAPGVAPCGPFPDFGASDILELTLN